MILNVIKLTESYFGLRNIWQGKLERFGFNTVGLETLFTIEHTHCFYIADTQAPLQRLQNNPI